MKFKKGDICVNHNKQRKVVIHSVYATEYHYCKYPMKDGDVFSYLSQFTFENSFKLYVPPYNSVWRGLND